MRFKGFGGESKSGEGGAPPTRTADLEEPPSVIPKVVFGPDGEPMVVREMLVRSSPVPRSIAIIVIIMAALTLAQGVYFSSQQAREQAKRNRDLTKQVAVNAALAKSAARAAAKADALSTEVKSDQKALTALVGTILTAKTPQEAQRALEKFLAEARQRGIPAPAPSEASTAPTATRQSSSSTSGSGSSRPSSQPTSHQQPSSQPSPKPSPSRTPLVCASVLGQQACVPRASVQNVGESHLGQPEQQRQVSGPRPASRGVLLTIALLLPVLVLCELVHHHRARS